MSRDDRTDVNPAAEDEDDPFGAVDGVQTGRHSNPMAKTAISLPNDPDLWKNTTPHLRILSPEDGCWEVDVTEKVYYLGRSADSQLPLPYKSVSRRHARIVREEGSYFLEDLSSVGGTFLNGKRIAGGQSVMLRHGDSIQVSRVVMQFRRDERHINNGPAHMQFSRVPGSVQLRLRTVHCAPSSIFDMGDTLLVGKGGGLSVPLMQLLETDKVVELEMSYPNGRWIRVLCEVVIVNQLGSIYINCLKLHKLSQQEHNDVIRDSKRDPWISVVDMEQHS